MRAGKLNKRITLQSFSATRNDTGEAVDTYATMATVWASVEPLSGREFIQAQKVSSEVSLKVRIRYRPDLTITTKNRVKFGTRYLGIEAVLNPEEGRRELLLMCRELPDGEDS